MPPTHPPTTRTSPTCPDYQHNSPLPTRPAPPAALFTTWGALATADAVRTSPYYTSTLLPGTADQPTLMFHAVHPVPRRYLRMLAPEQQDSLKRQLTRDPGYGHEMRGRVGCTVDAIDGVLWRMR